MNGGTVQLAAAALTASGTLTVPTGATFNIVGTSSTPKSGVPFAFSAANGAGTVNIAKPASITGSTGGKWIYVTL